MSDKPMYKFLDELVEEIIVAPKLFHRFEQLQAENEVAKKQLYEIAHLCENCRALNDAIYIAGGRKHTSTESGCDRCWVDELQAEKKVLKKEKEKLAGELLLIDNYCRINDIDIEQALKDK